MGVATSVAKTVPGTFVTVGGAAHRFESIEVATPAIRVGSLPTARASTSDLPLPEVPRGVHVGHAVDDPFDAAAASTFDADPATVWRHETPASVTRPPSLSSHALGSNAAPTDIAPPAHAATQEARDVSALAQRAGPPSYLSPISSVGPLAAAATLAAAIVLALYHRIQASRVLDHHARAAIHRALSERGSVVASRLARELGVNRTTIVFHLRTMEREGLVRSARHGRTVLWTRVGEAVRTQAVLAPAARGILDAVQRNPGKTGTEYARLLDMRQGHVVYHLERLVAAGHVQQKREGRSRRFWA